MATSAGSLFGWRPPQWSKPAMVSITVPAGFTTSSSGAPLNTPITAQTPGATPTLSLNVVGQQSAVAYVFDAVLSADHEQTLTKTHHPVQTGASISSHAYIEPASLVLYILMSDAAQQFVQANQTTAPYVQQWTGNPSKSVSAYQQVLALQVMRVPLTVTTRLRTYSNMLITRVTPREDSQTTTGARFRVEFEQLFIANTQASPLSARPNDTQSTGLGAVNTLPPAASVETQFNIDGIPQQPSQVAAPNMSSWLSGNPQGVDVPGAGAYSSTNVNSLQQLEAPR